MANNQGLSENQKIFAAFVICMLIAIAVCIGSNKKLESCTNAGGINVRTDNGYYCLHIRGE